MHKFFFYGSLRSLRVLKAVIGDQTDHLTFHAAFAPKSSLKKVVNENFPVITFDNQYPGVHGTLVKGLNEEDIARILFFEDVEFTPQTLIVELEGMTEEVSYFSEQKVKPSNTPWIYEEWKKDFEDLFVITAEIWMDLYGKYTAEEADQYWEEVKKQALEKYQSQLWD